MENETQTITLDDLTKHISLAVSNGVKTHSDALEAKLSDIFDKALVKYRVDNGPEKTGTVATDEKKADLAEAGLLGSISEFKFWDIPVGQAVAGGFVAILASEMVDGFLSKQSNMIKGVVKLAAAGAAVKWGGKFLGGTGSKAVALLLAFDAIRDITPLDSWANSIANKLSGVIPTGGLGAQLGGGQPLNNNVLNQANKVAGDYYKGTGV